MQDKLGSVEDIPADDSIVMITLSIFRELAVILYCLMRFEIRRVSLMSKDIAAMTLIVYNLGYP